MSIREALESPCYGEGRILDGVLVWESSWKDSNRMAFRSVWRVWRSSGGLLVLSFQAEVYLLLGDALFICVLQDAYSMY